MSERPRTITAERELQIRRENVFTPTMDAVLRELDAERETHDKTKAQRDSSEQTIREQERERCAAHVKWHENNCGDLPPGKCKKGGWCVVRIAAAIRSGK